MKALYVHAHYDDYEFGAAGTFELWRRARGEHFQARVLVCTDGAAGHQFRTRAETARLRFQEQTNSAKLGGYEFELLRSPQGKPFREASLQISGDLLAVLWQAIRQFEPDYLFCPPLPTDPLAGVHNDHVVIAEAVRRVAYMINVPHAFTPEYPADETRSVARKTPVILQVYDTYLAGGHGFDLAVDVEAAFDRIAEMSWCHQSQIKEWLPWVGRHNMEPPATLEAWKAALHARYLRRNRQLGLRSRRVLETFTLTAWGETPNLEAVLRDFPPVSRPNSKLAQCRRRLKLWGGA
jgi:LmbE family N-acetylglucosaminyl deacetylase